MNQKNQMPIREFSRLTGIRRENLRFYDQIGLLTPETRGENGYRYYARRQLNAAYLVSDLRELGVGLEEIRCYSEERTPEKMLELFARQEQRVRQEMERLREIRDIMSLHASMAKQAMVHGDGALFLEEREKEPFFLCPALPDGLNEDEGGIAAYEYAAAHGIHLGYPLGAVISKHHFEQGSVSDVHRYYFKTKHGHNAWKPAGQYAVAYGVCNPWRSEEIYLRLAHFLQAQGLQPKGDCYEECPLNEMSVQDPEQYCIRVEVPVEPRT